MSNFFMRQNMFLAEKGHKFRVIVQELILKVAEKNVRGEITENRLI